MGMGARVEPGSLLHLSFFQHYFELKRKARPGNIILRFLSFLYPIAT